MFSGGIELKEGEAEYVKSPTDVGSRRAKEEKATNHPKVIQLRRANPFDKFQLGLRQMLEDLMIQRMSDNDKIVTRYMDDKAFENTAFAILSKVIYETIPAQGR